MDSGMPYKQPLVCRIINIVDNICFEYVIKETQVRRFKAGRCSNLNVSSEADVAAVRACIQSSRLCAERVNVVDTKKIGTIGIGGVKMGNVSVKKR
ncbi:hypothetical protein O3M35_009981 [Rhynocoris fuscipes]|uniref:Uncharacterized protein n=1 Tax=Rhynocoris fuscipes TaxID=488301 RepID=A0AAW1CY96_9HEMI